MTASPDPERPLRLSVRAQHTTTRLAPTGREDAAAAYHRVTGPARRGDAHLVTQSARTLCGQDASGWRTVTSARWSELNELRCAACQQEAVRLKRES